MSTVEWMKDFIRLGLGISEAGLPFRIETGIRPGAGDRAPAFFITIFNHSKDLPLLVRGVRVHFGNQHCDHAFALLSQKTVELLPRTSREFHLLFWNAGTEIQRTLLRKNDPLYRGSDVPLVDSGVSLFKAIAYGKAADSWIEIDYNECHGSRFRRGLLKRNFVQILAMTVASHPPS